MFIQRALVTIVLLPLGVALIVLGGWPLTALVATFLGVAAWEYSRLFHAQNLKLSWPILVGSVLLILVGRAWNGFESAPWILSLLVLALSSYALVDYERGNDRAALEFCVTLGGIFYIGWLGAYLVSLRDLPDGKWWMLIVLPAVWFADSGAYMIGKRFGRHQLSPRLSPKKTWEGYLGGIVFGVALTWLLAAIFQFSAGPAAQITPGRGALIGLVMGVLPTLGDLAESMFKRQAGIKDSSNLLPGHGGAFDRIDSWLWAAVFGYYLIQPWIDNLF